MYYKLNMYTIIRNSSHQRSIIILFSDPTVMLQWIILTEWTYDLTVRRKYQIFLIRLIFPDCTNEQCENLRDETRTEINATYPKVYEQRSFVFSSSTSLSLRVFFFQHCQSDFSFSRSIYKSMLFANRKKQFIQFNTWFYGRECYAVGIDGKFIDIV